MIIIHPIKWYIGEPMPVWSSFIVSYNINITSIHRNQHTNLISTFTIS